jgi:hypothetical protein
LQRRLKKYENNDAVKDLLQDVETKIKINQVYVDQEALMKQEFDENLKKENEENTTSTEENKQDLSSRLASYNKYTDKGNNY